MNDASRRRFLKSAGLTAACAGLSRHRIATAAPAAGVAAVDPLSLVDPALRAELLKYLPDMDKEVYDTATLPAMRRLSERWGAKPDPSPSFELQTIPGPSDNPRLNVYVINRGSARNRPAILHIHGGGYIVGRAVDGIKRLQQISARLNCLIVTVDYRLAPEAKFPAALEDNYAALKWLHAHAEELGVDKQRIAVMGESAGGGHAAALAIAARDRGDVALCCQALVYPMLDDRTGSTRQPAPWIGTYVWRRAANVFGWTSMLGVPAGSNDVPRGAVPARIDNLNGLAPAFIGVGSIDLFVDEDIDYARRLLDSGVPTELYVVAGGYHGFNEFVPGAPSSVNFEKALIAALERGFSSGR